MRNAIHMSGNQAKNIHSELSIACRRKVGITCWRQVKKKKNECSLSEACRGSNWDQSIEYITVTHKRMQ